ncbi:hypothetical protein B0H17DRAFT_428085 [Mycena rosella]|uniref:Uncharacterized protein n=1 Tax=Mycena rosella TaxID=1033263 RepID=A0AAD7G1H0_MYCRO|nr:hypothetical protein B0H17DRAFT_428085 [Mycena rosella]
MWLAACTSSMALFGAYTEPSISFFPQIPLHSFAIDDIRHLPPAPAPRPSLVLLVHARTIGTFHLCLVPHPCQFPALMRPSPPALLD